MLYRRINENIKFIDDEVVTDAEERIQRVYRSVYSDDEKRALLEIRQNKNF